MSTIFIYQLIRHTEKPFVIEPIDSFNKYNLLDLLKKKLFFIIKKNENYKRKMLFLQGNNMYNKTF